MSPRASTTTWSTRAQMDPGSVWLRKLMLETRRELDRDRRKAAWFNVSEVRIISVRNDH